MERDKLVFTEVRKNRGKPIFMVTSGGYQVGVVSGWGQSAAMNYMFVFVSCLPHVCCALSPHVMSLCTLCMYGTVPLTSTLQCNVCKTKTSYGSVALCTWPYTCMYMKMSATKLPSCVTMKS